MVASAFALSTGGDFNKTPVTDVCIWVAGFDEDIKTNLDLTDQKQEDQIHFVTTPLSNKRMQAQRGLFSYTKSQKCLTEIADKNNDLFLYRFCLTNDFLGKLNEQHKAELKAMGVSPMRIYPDHKGLKEEVIGCSKNIRDESAVPKNEDEDKNQEQKELKKDQQEIRDELSKLNNQ